MTEKGDAGPNLSVQLYYTQMSTFKMSETADKAANATAAAGKLHTPCSPKPSQNILRLNFMILIHSSTGIGRGVGHERQTVGETGDKS
jgi:hypothetical protein